MLMAALDSTIVSTALPTIVGVSAGWSTSLVVPRICWPRRCHAAYGKFGRRKLVLQVGLVIFLVGSVLCGQAVDDRADRLSRAAGLGGGGSWSARRPRWAM
jgi:hypothetical protein